MGQLLFLRVFANVIPNADAVACPGTPVQIVGAQLPAGHKIASSPVSNYFV